MLSYLLSRISPYAAGANRWSVSLSAYRVEDEVSDSAIEERITRLVEAFRDSEALLNYLWAVMEGADNGVTRDEIVSGVFAGDTSQFGQGRAQVEDAWGKAGKGAPPSPLISETSDGRLVMFKPAQDIVYDLLNTD